MPRWRRKRSRRAKAKDKEEIETNKILKTALVQKGLLNEQELALINRQALKPLEAEQVFTFRLAACDDQPDRDGERFTPQTLEQLAPLFVGKPVLRDHDWSAGAQTARVYAAQVEQLPDRQALMLDCYMPRLPETAGVIAAMEAGILRECSVSVAVRRALCSICGANQGETLCPHIPGRQYEGQTCVMELEGGADAYEVSLVAVPAQRQAGVVKSKRYGESAGQRDWRRRAMLRMERARTARLETESENGGKLL